MPSSAAAAAAAAGRPPVGAFRVSSPSLALLSLSLSLCLPPACVSVCFLAALLCTAEPPLARPPLLLRPALARLGPATRLALLVCAKPHLPQLPITHRCNLNHKLILLSTFKFDAQYHQKYNYLFRFSRRLSSIKAEIVVISTAARQHSLAP